MFVNFDCIFVSSAELYDIDLSSEGGIYTFDNKKENPNPEYKYLVRCGGGYQAFRFKREAVKWHNDDY